MVLMVISEHCNIGIADTSRDKPDGDGALREAMPRCLQVLMAFLQSIMAQMGKLRSDCGDELAGDARAMIDGNDPHPPPGLDQVSSHPHHCFAVNTLSHKLWSHIAAVGGMQEGSLQTTKHHVQTARDTMKDLLRRCHGLTKPARSYNACTSPTLATTFQLISSSTNRKHIKIGFCPHPGLDYSLPAKTPQSPSQPTDLGISLRIRFHHHTTPLPSPNTPAM